MIRIRNISRENSKLRRKERMLYLASGDYVRVMFRREVVIDYATYLKNQPIICLPGEPYGELTVFLVVAGVEEILRESGSTLKEEEPVMPTTITQPPEDTIPQEDDTVDEAENELPVEENEEDAIDHDAAETPEEPVVSEEEPQEEEGVDAPKLLIITNTHDELMKMNHKDLNDMLNEFGVKVPANSNKDVKVDALLRLNG